MQQESWKSWAIDVIGRDLRYPNLTNDIIYQTFP